MIYYFEKTLTAQTALKTGKVSIFTGGTESFFRKRESCLVSQKDCCRF